MDEVKTAKREDISPKEGKRKYGDVTFADEKNKKYPIDTEEHIRAAWNYINKEKNAAKYSAKDASAIKRKIISAWKRKIDKDGPPSAGKSAYFSDDTMSIEEMSDSAVEEVWNSMEPEMKGIAVEFRAITDAPKLRSKDAQCCSGCNLWKYLPRKDCDYKDEDVISLPHDGICTKYECTVDASWVCDSFEQWNWDDHKPGGKYSDEPKEEDEEPEETKSVRKVAPIKMVGETRFAGYGLRFAADEREKDLTGTKFKKDTNYGSLYQHAPIYYHHGMNPTVDLEQIGATVKAQVDDIGIWVEGELNKSAKYWKGVAELIKQGKLFYSSGTAEHLIRYGDNGSIKNWPVIEWTLTPTPAEPRLNSVAFYKSIGLDLDGVVDDKGAVNARQKHETRNESPDNVKTNNILEVDMEASQVTELVQGAVKAALEAEKAASVKAAQEAEAKRQAEELHAQEVKAAAEQAVAAYKASLPVNETQRPGYGKYNIAQRPLGEFSWVKAVRGIVQQAKGATNAWSGAEKERDIMTKYAGEVRASLAEGAGNLGGYLVPPEYMQDAFIPLLRARSVVRAAGPRVLQTNSDIVYIPQQTGGASAYWLGENSTITPSNMTFGQLAINIRKLAALEYISNELLADASPSADQLIREDLAAVIALKEDATFLLSNGAAPSYANAPVGYVNYPGITSVSLTNDGPGNGAALIAADIFQFKKKLMQANVPFDNMAWFCSPRTWDEIAQLKDAQNRYILETLTGGNISQYPAYGNYPEGPETSFKGSVQGRLLGWPVYVTANIPEDVTWGNASTASYLIFTRMPDTIIVERMGLELMATNVAGTAFASDQTWIRAIERVGFGVRHAPAVAVAGGLL